MLWPPLVRIMAECLNIKWYQHACVLVSMASSAATILVYLFAPICIQISGWKGVFILPAVLGTGAAAIWLRCTGKLSSSGGEAEKPEEASGTANPQKAPAPTRKKSLLAQLLADAPLAAILVAIVLQGIL